MAYRAGAMAGASAASILAEEIERRRYLRELEPGHSLCPRSTGTTDFLTSAGCY